MSILLYEAIWEEMFLLQGHRHALKKIRAKFSDFEGSIMVESDEPEKILDFRPLLALFDPFQNEIKNIQSMCY